MSDADRDRDPSGRARNARPRDELGRPLPRGAPDVPRAPEGLVRSPDETLTEAQRLLDDGRPFHAHEVLEDAWKATEGPDRELWRGLAQLAVAMTHAARGNEAGAASLFRRSAETLAPFTDDAPFDVDVRSLRAWAHDAATRTPDSLIAPRLRGERSAR